MKTGKLKYQPTAMPVILLLSIMSIVCTACRQTTGGQQGEVIARGSFGKEIHISPKPMPTDTMIAFENWNMMDSLLLVESNGTENIFYLLHPKHLKTKCSFGKRGNGPEEFTMPHLIQGSPGIMILDNALHVIRWLSSETGRTEKETALPAGKAYWHPCYFDENTLCLIESSPNELKWLLYDIPAQEVKDSLLFVDETNKGNAVQYEFAYYADSARLAISFNYDNVVSYYNIHNKKLIPRFTIKGEKQDGKMYGTDILVFEDNIYVLNQENIDMQTYEGESFLDVYSNEGNSLCRIHLNMIAGCMQMDKQNGRILFYSPLNEEAFFSLPLSELQTVLPE